jgi:hypothetical protein
MQAPRRLQLRRGNTAAVSTYLGAPGELIVNTDTSTLFVHDGVTVGGIATTVNVATISGQITAANVGMRGYVDFSIQSNIANIAPGYTDTNVRAYLGAFNGNIIPSANVAYSLGNITHQWRDLFVSNTTIYIGGVALSIDVSGNLTVGGNTIPTTAYVNQQVANVTVDLSSYALNANVTAANVGMLGYVNQANTIQSAQIAAANVGMLGYVNQANTIQSAQITAANVGMKGYVDSQSFYSNTKVATYLASNTDHTFGANVIIQGNLVVNGNVNYVNVNNLVISDNIINLADLNPDDSLDLGLSAHRTVNDILQHTGLVRHAADNEWKLFSNVISQPGTTVDFTNAIYDDIRVGNITSPTVDSLVNAIAAANIGIKGYIDQGNTIQSTAITQANLGMKGYVDNAVSTIVIPVTYSNINVKAYTETMGFANYGNVNVAAYLTTNDYLTSATANLANYAWASNVTGGGSSNYSNVNVAAYLATATITTTGNITAQYLTGNINITGNVAGTSPNVTLVAGSFSSTFDNQGNVRLPNAYVSGNVISTYFIGNGSQLTGLPSSYSNVQVAAYLNATGYNLYSNVNVAAYLSTASITTTGNITAQNLSGNITITGNVTGTSANVTLQAGAFISVFDNQGNVRLPSAYVTGNVTANYFVGNGALLTGIVAGSNYSNVQVATYLPTYSGNIANIRLGISGVLTFADGTTLATASAIGGSTYGNANVASYLITNGYVNTNSAYGNGNVASYLITNQYINANSAYSNANVTSYLPTHSGNVGVNNIIGTTPNVTLVSNSYSTTYDIYGNVAFGNAAYPVQIYATGSITTNSNLTVGGMGVIIPNRPAFRVNGVNPGSQSTADVNLKGSAITTAYNQGNHFNATTGIFTAPVSGIYEVLLNARVNGSFNGLGQLVVLKNGLNSGGNVVAFWETTSNIGGATHFGVSGTVVLTAGDYLSANILAGNVTFDQNDNWCVTYLG